jgi:hypothetical protein
MGARVERLTSDNEADFFRLHGEPDSAGWCWCVAWWTDSWEGFGDRTSRQNRRLRDSLFARGERDGYLLYDDGEAPGARSDVVGWCQVGPRDRLPKLLETYRLDADPTMWGR